ncbi:MAG: MBL fold metallo-hydrolase [Thermoplasmata archaeon]|nr:MBL fold metallo-hydrolase [Thermoplasmata archaeon]WII07816.1 MBL fold metallo-hydrolase [Methanomassiliicoccales archaeon LGM-RCC1]
MAFRITFLGTGGGRHTTMYQVRSTGGMLIEHDGKMLNVDPGPGALVQMQRIHYDVCNTSSMIISHCHPDHYSDAECVAEGMSHGGWKKRGHIYGSPTVIEGEAGLGPCVSPYHLRIVEGYKVFRPGDVLDVDGMRVDIKKAVHSDPTNVGFVFHTDHGDVSYVSDTEFSVEIAQQYIGTRVLILPVTTPMGNRIKWHLCTDDAIKFIEIVKPELAIFIHLGVVIIRRGPENEAKMTEDATGIRTVAARDLMILDVGEELNLSDAETFDDHWIPSSSV